MTAKTESLPRVVHSVRVAGIASAIPETVASKVQDEKRFGTEAVEKISQSTGVTSRHVTKSLCTSDLCFNAATKLLHESSVSASEIDTLVFVTQTPDHVLPATACVLQERLGLPVTAAAFDVNLGCSGYVYGLWLAASLIAGGGSRRVLLLVGDTISRVASPEDRSVAMLFGDAGTATLLEFDERAEPLYFALGTDGSGANNLIVPHGGFRRPIEDRSFQKIERENQNFRSDADLYMNGPEIFSFTLSRVPSLIGDVLRISNLTHDDIDAFVFHQANKFMLEHLAKRMKIPADRMIYSLEKSGNTSSASIPLALCNEMSVRLKDGRNRLLLGGFGVGYSWAGCIATVRDLVIPDVVLVSEECK